MESKSRILILFKIKIRTEPIPIWFEIDEPFADRTVITLCKPGGGVWPNRVRFSRLHWPVWKKALLVGLRWPVVFSSNDKTAAELVGCRRAPLEMGTTCSCIPEVLLLGRRQSTSSVQDLDCWVEDQADWWWQSLCFSYPVREKAVTLEELKLMAPTSDA